MDKKFLITSPKQVLAILNREGINVKSTNEDALQKYKDHPLVKALLEYRGAAKVCTTYTKPLYKNAIKSPDNRIHTRFGQNTITGRLSSSDPINLQNQPPSVRSGFVAGDGYKFVGADWSNVELYLPAAFSGEPNWLRILCTPDGDLHMATAARLFGESVWGLPEKERKAKRKIAKETLLTITNSGTFKSLATTLQCSEKEAKEFEQATKALYPVFVRWLETTKKKAREQGGISTYFGRWVSLVGLSSWCGRPNCQVFGPGRGEFCKPCFVRQETEKQAISIKVQGSASDLCKLAALRLYKDYGYVPEALVHDEIIINVKESEVGLAKERLKFVMENVWIFTPALKAVVNTGDNWSQLK